MFPETQTREKQTSQKQIEANRLNAKKSTGPTSAEGKARVSLNALRHGLTGHVTVRNNDDRAAHDLHMAGYFKSLKPEEPMERDLVEAIAEDAWRLKHARALDQNVFALAQTETVGTEPAQAQPEGIDDDETTGVVALNARMDQIMAALGDAQTFLREAPKFQLLTLYEQRLQRAFTKNLALLRELQAERKAARDKAFSQAQLLAQMSYAEGKPWQPESEPRPTNGFVFSSAEINAEIRHQRRLEEAFYFSRKGWDLTKGARPALLTLIDSPPLSLPQAA